MDKERYHRLTLRGDGPTGTDVSEILIDGQKLEGVTRVRFEVDHNGWCEATVTLYVRPDFDLPMPVTLEKACGCPPEAAVDS